MAVRRKRTYAAAGVAVVVALLAAPGCGLAGSRGPQPPTVAPSASSPSSTTAASVPPSASSSAEADASARPEPAAPATPDQPAAPAALLAAGDSGAKVRELQHRLGQLEWYDGSITGHYRFSTVRAVRGFQDKRGFGVTGAVDRRTWSSLVSRTRMPSDDELHNRLTPGPALLRQGSSGDRVRALQARLQQIGWFAGSVSGSYGSVTSAAVRGFQDKRAIPVTGDVDQRTWDRLTGMTRTPTADELHNRTPKPSATGLDRRCLTGRALCVSKATNSLVWVVDGKAQLRTDVRFGSAELPTREGAFAVGWKSRNHVSTIYHTSMPYAMFFSGGQAVHYSPDFAARGYNGASHGCVNVRDLGVIQTLFTQVRVGDKVIVYR